MVEMVFAFYPLPFLETSFQNNYLLGWESHAFAKLEGEFVCLCACACLCAHSRACLFWKVCKSTQFFLRNSSQINIGAIFDRIVIKILYLLLAILLRFGFRRYCQRKQDYGLHSQHYKNKGTKTQDKAIGFKLIEYIQRKVYLMCMSRYLTYFLGFFKINLSHIAKK